jgi:hypothetical protein
METLNHFFISIIVTISLMGGVNGQSSLNNFTYEIEAIPNDLGMPELDTLYTLKCIILVSEPDSVSNIYIKVGTIENGEDIFNHVFTNSTAQQLPEGTTFLKQGNRFFIMLGDYFNYKFYYQVKLEDLVGNITEPVLINL